MRHLLIFLLGIFSTTQIAAMRARLDGWPEHNGWRQREPRQRREAFSLSEGQKKATEESHEEESFENESPG